MDIDLIPQALPVDLQCSVADPEVLARGDELRGPMAPPQNFFLNFKSKKMRIFVHLSIDFKVCMLITETVSDHIRKTVTSRLCFPLLEPQRQEPGSIATTGTSSTFSYT